MVIKTWSTPVRSEGASPIPCPLCGGEDFIPALSCQDFSYVRCSSCGLVQINPQPPREAVLSRYAPPDYRDYELRNEASFLHLQQLGLRDSGFFDLEAESLPGPLLDIGCATGTLLEYLRSRHWLVQGLEISEPQAEYAREQRHLLVSSRPLEESAYPSSSFSVILASHLIEHLNNPRSFVEECFRILKRGGRFYVTTPNIAGFQARIFREQWRSAIFDHLFLFSRSTLSRLLREGGFIIEKTVTWGGLAAGSAPGLVKKIADTLVKPLGIGDVMLLRCRKPL